MYCRLSLLSFIFMSYLTNWLSPYRSVKCNCIDRNSFSYFYQQNKTCLHVHNLRQNYERRGDYRVNSISHNLLQVFLMWKTYPIFCQNTTHIFHAALWISGYVSIWCLHLKLVINQQTHSSDLTAMIQPPNFKNMKFKLRSLHASLKWFHAPTSNLCVTKSRIMFNEYLNY